jgi:hypothetical protein
VPIRWPLRLNLDQKISLFFQDLPEINLPKEDISDPWGFGRHKVKGQLSLLKNYQV